MGDDDPPLASQSPKRILNVGIEPQATTPSIAKRLEGLPVLLQAFAHAQTGIALRKNVHLGDGQRILARPITLMNAPERVPQLTLRHTRRPSKLLYHRVERRDKISNPVVQGVVQVTDHHSYHAR